MNLVVGALATLAAVAVTVTAMLLVRRRAPEGSRFNDGDRASGVFGVLATGFSVLLGFIIFLAFQSYDEARSGAEDEAQRRAAAADRAVPARRRRAGLTGDLVCYARDVVGREWPACRTAPWATRSTRGASSCSAPCTPSTPTTDVEQSAYDRWMDQTADREQARIDGCTAPRDSSRCRSGSSCSSSRA